MRHARDAEYETEKFDLNYPMAALTYGKTEEDGTNVEDVWRDLDNYRFDFTTLSGAKVTSEAQNGKGKLLIFGTTGSNNSANIFGRGKKTESVKK